MLAWLRKRLGPAATAGDEARSPAPATTGAAAAPPPLPPAPELPAHAAAFEAGRISEAETLATQALAEAATDFAAALTLARVAVHRRRGSEARRAIERLRGMAPARGEADWLAGALEVQAGRRDAAMAAFEAAITKDPTLADAHLRLSDLWRERGEHTRALQACEAAVRADPRHAAARNNLGSLLRAQGHSAAALPHFEAATQADPTLAEAWFNLGALQLDLGRHAQAAEALQRSLALKPDQADAAYWLGHARMALGDAESAREAYAEALKRDSQFLRARWALAMAQIDPLPMDEAAEAASRLHFEQALDKLGHWLRTRAPANAFEAAAVTQPYYLAYQEADARPLLEAYGRLCALAMAPWAKKQGLAALPSPAPRPAPAGAGALTSTASATGAATSTSAASSSNSAAATGVVRVGIASAHLHDHSVWNAIVRGWVEHLDPARCELHLFSLGGREDRETAFARQRAHAFHGALGGWQDAARAMADSRLQVLIYPEIGMDSATGKLAALRLAPVQIACWGHPVTTGLPTIDHYLSADGMEPPDAQLQYSERLHRLPGLGCSPRRYGTRAAKIDRSRWGIPPGTRLLLCAGMPFKYRPRYDAWWVEVARRCAPCRLIFFRGQPEALAQRLEQRLRAAFTAAGLDFDAHVLFVPWQSQADYFGWLEAAEVFLDSPGFSGFNTVMQAVECGTPIVAYEGSALRGRFGSGILQRLGLQAWVATDLEAYAGCAAQLCNDAALRQRTARTIRERGAALFEDQAANAALQALLLELAMPAATPQAAAQATTPLKLAAAPASGSSPARR